MCPPGVDSISHYEQALRQVRYRNWRPASLSERRFRLTCSELNGRYTSNEFNMEVRLALLAPDLMVFLLHLSFFWFCRSAFFTNRRPSNTSITWLQTLST